MRGKRGADPNRSVRRRWAARTAAHTSARSMRHKACRPRPFVSWATACQSHLSPVHAHHAAPQALEIGRAERREVSRGVVLQDSALPRRASYEPGIIKCAVLVPAFMIHTPPCLLL